MHSVFEARVRKPSTWYKMSCKTEREAGAMFSHCVIKPCHCCSGVSYRNLFRWGKQHIKNHCASFVSLSYLMPQPRCCFPAVHGSCGVSLQEGLHTVLSLRPLCWLPWETTADLFSSKVSPKCFLNTHVTHILRLIIPDIKFPHLVKIHPRFSHDRWYNRFIYMTTFIMQKFELPF